jgi:hypothetical protein
MPGPPLHQRAEVYAAISLAKPHRERPRGVGAALQRQPMAGFGVAKPLVSRAGKPENGSGIKSLSCDSHPTLMTRPVASSLPRAWATEPTLLPAMCRLTYPVRAHLRCSSLFLKTQRTRLPRRQRIEHVFFVSKTAYSSHSGRGACGSSSLRSGPELVYLAGVLRERRCAESGARAAALFDLRATRTRGSMGAAVFLA